MAAKQINLTLGTAGHIDHGKTALVKLLTGCDTDRLKEEKERGMSIDLGFAPCVIADAQVGIVDVPGHEHFIKTMVAGATAMDAVMLVVAADDGVMPQTREHLEILTLLGVRHGLVALTKIDRVEPAQRDAAIEQVRGFLEGTFLADAPLCPVSSVTGEGLDGFLAVLGRLIESLEPKSLDGVFRMPVDRAFSARGFGTVVAGVPLAGSVGIDDELVLLPDGLTSRIRQIEVYGQSSDVVRAGQCAAVNVRHWDAGAIRRGHVVTLPGYFEPQSWFLGRLRLLGHEKNGLKNGAQVRLHTGTTEVTAGVYSLDAGRMAEGAEHLVQIHATAPIVAGPGDPFILRSLSPVRTIGGGTLVEGLPRKLKRNRPGGADDLAERAAAIADERRFVAYAVKTAPARAAGEDELARRTKIPRARVRAILAELTAAGEVSTLAPGVSIHRDTADALGQRLVELIEAFHRRSPESPGIAPEELREQAGLERAVVDGLVARLAEDGRLARRNDRWAAAGHAPTFQDEEAAQLEAIEARLREAGFAPPGIDELCQATGLDRPAVERLLTILRQHQRVVRVEDGILFHCEAVERARQILLDYFAREERLESVQFKYMLDTTRKFAIPLLDHFDRVGVTRRVGNTRYPKKANR
ncbi:MAG: selenocysteine-specific translation elongation factor [Pirellulales bacterium]|nr:selenocysteine-specific translation elongation factor [Pirellulales bacterium]